MKKISLLASILALNLILVWLTSARAQVEPADTFIEGKVYQLDCGAKLDHIVYDNKNRPVAIIRVMRQDEQPTNWFIRRVDKLDEGPLPAEPTIIIKECK